MFKKNKIVDRTAIFGANRCLVLLDQYDADTAAECLVKMVWEAAKIMHPTNDGDKKYNKMQKTDRKNLLLKINKSFNYFIDQLIKSDAY